MIDDTNDWPLAEGPLPPVSQQLEDVVASQQKQIKTLRSQVEELQARIDQGTADSPREM